MTREFEILKSHNLKPESTFARPVQILPEHVKLDDPALSALTDFNKVSLVVARPTLLLDDCQLYTWRETNAFSKEYGWNSC